MTRGGEVLYESLVGLADDGTLQHSTALLTKIEQAVAAVGGWDEVGLIATGLGPGSFVGIRIGISTARGLALSTGLPVRGVCTLDALGRALVAHPRPAGLEPHGENRVNRSNLAVLDARRGEAFAASYSNAGERLWAPLVAPPEALLERLGELPEPLLAAGAGAVRFRGDLESREVEVPDDANPVHRISARHICAIAEAKDEGGGKALDPIYLRPPDAQRWLERDTPQRSG